VDVVLDIVLCHIEARVDQLEINLFEKLFGLGLLPDFETEWYVRGLQNVAPKTANVNFLILFFLVGWDVAGISSVGDFVLC